MTPARLQLSRLGGFNLQKTSHALNGLEAAKVARPSIFGNPFKISDMVSLREAGLLADQTPRAAAVRCFRDWLEGKTVVGQRATVVSPPSAQLIRDHLHGKNLACWCRADQPCHADVLLEIANR